MCSSFTRVQEFSNHKVLHFINNSCFLRGVPASAALQSAAGQFLQESTLANNSTLQSAGNALSSLLSPPSPGMTDLAHWFISFAQQLCQYAFALASWQVSLVLLSAYDRLPSGSKYGVSGQQHEWWLCRRISSIKFGQLRIDPSPQFAICRYN